MKVLVINCGSSSLKYRLIDMAKEECIAKGLVERIGLKDSVLTQKSKVKHEYKISEEVKDHQEAIKLVLKALVDKMMGRSEFKGVSPVDAFCGLEDTRY